MHSKYPMYWLHPFLCVFLVQQFKFHISSVHRFINQLPSEICTVWKILDVFPGWAWCTDIPSIKPALCLLPHLNIYLILVIWDSHNFSLTFPLAFIDKHPETPTKRQTPWRFIADRNLALVLPLARIKSNLPWFHSTDSCSNMHTYTQIIQWLLSGPLPHTAIIRSVLCW